MSEEGFPGGIPRTEGSPERRAAWGLRLGGVSSVVLESMYEIVGEGNGEEKLRRSVWQARCRGWPGGGEEELEGRSPAHGV